jgi:membrane-associated phospholipid phosphatase
MPRIILLLLLFFSAFAKAQYVRDSIAEKKLGLKFKPAALILPAALITYGAIGIHNDPLNDWDHEIRDALGNRGQRTMLDDITRFAPIGAVYALDFAGIKAKTPLLDRTIILGGATALMFTSVKVTKNNAAILRPGGGSLTSFPSGHTALAFMGAEFLHHEYGHHSVWYSIAGYTVAGATGFIRIYNDKHWLTDVVAGAGFGILSMKIAYWLYPTIKSLFQSSEKPSKFEVGVAPVIQQGDLLIGASIKF